MKNIHIIQTDKPSILIKDIWKNTFSLVENFNTNHTDFKAQHIYITNDEEIKEGDFFIAYSVSDKKPYISCASEYKERKKDKGRIILTTDVDLIVDGVQPIDDEFLEFIVNNPRCQNIEVEIIPDFIYDTFYKIKIQDTKTKCYCGHTTYCDCGPE